MCILCSSDPVEDDVRKDNPGAFHVGMMQAPGADPLCLATREQRNPQFDFLKPTHPLFAYFTALVESYTLVLAKQDAQMKRIEEGMGRMKVLDRCVHRMEWQRTEQERKDKEAAESDAERRALAQIDWHDFVVVETINFDDDDDLGASATVGESEAKGSDDDMDMEEDDDDEPKPEIKVVEDYVPQATAATAQQPLLSVDGKTLSSAEANEHMRILLMNPKWREETQRHLEKQKESSYAAGSAIADSLRRFATKLHLAWPFILECCGNDTHFAFDHFQFKRNTETDMPELAYVGELQLSMASFNSYLEKYLSNVPGKDVVVLEDHVTKKTITIVASENIIALNNLVLAKYCAQLYNDLIKGFQWDVFAGGIHCLLQYLPQSSWHEKFSSPRLHFNFPGARGSLADPGNGTTDTAYQVLVGSLELVIFERFEPQYKADFDLILQRAGYDAERKTMLLDAHLRALRSAGFAFSTVLLQDGEFVHVNKGRQHFWRVVEKDSVNGSINAPMCPDGWVFDPRRAIVEAAKCGVAIVRTVLSLMQGDRMWEFAVPILFMEIFVDTLLPGACFSLVMYASCLIVIPSVGRQLDAANRWKAMRLAIILENANIIASTALLGAMLLLTDADGFHKPEWTWPLTLLFVGTLICGGVGQVLSEAQTLGIERDWVVIIAQSSGTEPSSALASLNTILRRIDLACKLLGPLAFGVIMDFAGRDPTTRAMIGASTVAIWNGLSTPLEYFMTQDIYKLVPELAIKESSKQPNDEEELASADDQSTLSRYVGMWRNYSRHPVFLLSFSYCALYMTVLDNGSLNTAYLKWRGVPGSLLASSRGAGAVFGLLGTVLFPYLRRTIPRLECVAVLSIWLFWLCLAPILVAFLLSGESRVSDYVMLCCMVGARMWLWSADLTETQLMQEWIEPSRRGAVNAMQTATCQLFYMLIQVVGIIFHDPRQFEALVLFSVATVLAAAMGFTLWDVRYGCHRSLYARSTTGTMKTIATP
ncbi:Coiled-coil domain-containing protein 63 [Phytophthora nicotianae]|uniref:Coiled-coil domain-containing protein 63 n=1 Tax=Phytophthora nicotianae TaxID=4792 RepID=A0A0W8DTL1_PHYNI|nr:Coiled-coil domain-containing protein 63 [Phytophthora nicotianae]